MITVKDIARLASVSQGTVSNVLNNRGNVSAEKIQRVTDAAKQLGYVANAQAKLLRKDIPLSNHIAVILPNIDEKRYTYFFNGIKLILEEKGYTPLLFVTDESPYREEQIATHVAEMRVSGIVTVTSALSHHNIYQSALDSGARILYAFRKVPHAGSYIGFDFYEIGREIGKYADQKNYRRIAVISDPESCPENRDFVAGVREALQAADPSRCIQVKTADWLNISVSPFDFFDGCQEAPDAIILSNSSFLPKVELAFSVFAGDWCPPIITVSSESNLQEQTRVTTYSLDYLYAGIQAAHNLLADLNNSLQTDRTILQGGGLHRLAAAPPVHCEKTKLRILLSRSESNTALQRIAPKFERLTGISVDFTEISLSEIFSETLLAAKNGSFDLVRSNMSCLPLLPDDIFYTFDKAEFHEITQHMIPRITKDFSYIKGKPQAIPFDIGLDMMVYRKDLFEDPLLKRMYYEQSGKMLEVPSTFEQYEQVVRFFDRESNPHSPVQCGTGMNWDSPVELSSSFFLRYINFVKDHKFKRGKTRIEEDAVLKTLENIYVCGQHALPVQGKQWVGATLDNFISGQTAVEFVFLNYASNIAHLQKIIYGGKVGCANVPGGISYITGGSFSIFNRSPNISAAREFLHWISSYPQTELLTLYGGLSPYAKVYQKSEILMQYPWYSYLQDKLGSAIGREIWDVFNQNKCTLLQMPLLQGIEQGQQRPEQVLPQMMDILQEALL